MIYAAENTDKKLLQNDLSYGKLPIMVIVSDRKGSKMKVAESGRSMVEMLGVLAIIGVITVGAMIGYRYAMERIMTNSIITGVRARAVVIGQQRVLGHPLNLSEFHPDTEKDLIYGHFEVKAFNNYMYDGEERQALEVYNIPKRVCEKIQDTEFPDDHITLVNGKEVGDTPQPCIPDGPTENTGGIHDAGDYLTAEYHNTVTFVFMNLGTEACEDDSDCPICQACSEGVCHYKGDGASCDNPAGGCCSVGQCRPGNSRSCQCNGYVPQSGEHVCCSRGHQEDTPQWSCCLAGHTTGTKDWRCCVNPNALECQPPVNRCENVSDICQTCDPATGTITQHDDGVSCSNPSGGCCINGTCVAGNSTECLCVAYRNNPKEYQCCTAGHRPETKEWRCCLDSTLAECQPPDLCQDITCDACKKCNNGDCVADSDKNDQPCGSNGCSVCENGSCLNKMTQIKKCDGTKENCCPLTTICTDKTDCPIDCTETPGPCQKCDTTTGKLVPDKEGESCGTCGTCTNGECQEQTKTVTTCSGERTCCLDDPTCQDETDCPCDPACGNCERCVSGGCQPDSSIPGCGGDTTCPGGCGECKVCENGTCVSNGDLCCGVSCGTCQVCQEGTCVADTTAEECQCPGGCGECEVCENGTCVADTTSDECKGCSGGCGECETCENGTCVQTGVKTNIFSPKTGAENGFTDADNKAGCATMVSVSQGCIPKAAEGMIGAVKICPSVKNCICQKPFEWIVGICHSKSVYYAPQGNTCKAISATN